MRAQSRRYTHCVRYLWYRGYRRYLAVYLYIYVYEAPGVYPSRLGSQGVWD